MPGSDTSFVTFVVTYDNSISERIQIKLLTEHSKQLYRYIVRPYRYCLSCRDIRASERSPACILDASGLAHLHSDMSVVCSASGVPPTIIPGKGLVNCTIVPINKSVDTGLIVRSLIPVLNKNSCTRLSAAY